MIEIHEVCKNYNDNHVLRGFDLHIDQGSILGLVGTNGSGKTTLLNLISGIYKCDKGQISVESKDVFENTLVKEKIAYICDQPFFFQQKSLKQYAKFLSGIYKSFDFDFYRDLVKRFEIDEKKAIKSFSKGMRKQANYIAFLAIRPKLLLIDELVDGIDPIKRRLVWSTLLEEVDSNNMTVIIASHNLMELENVCSHLAVLHEGHCVLSSNIEDMREHLGQSMEEAVINQLGGIGHELKEIYE